MNGGKPAAHLAGLGPAADQALRLTWLGHATVRIELDGVCVLTDPLVRRRVVHLTRATAVPPEAYQNVDAVLISHAHYDHLDVPSLRKIGRSVRLIVPRGVRGFLGRRGFRDVTELAEGDETNIGAVRVRAVFAAHSNMRASPIARSPTLGYVLSGSQLVYFAGDTDLFPAMASFATGLDVALLPIAGWGKSTGPGHLGPREAAEALRILSPRVCVPIHWGTYVPLSPRRGQRADRADPATAFRLRVAEFAPNVEVRLLEPGGTTAVRSVNPRHLT